MRDIYQVGLEMRTAQSAYFKNRTQHNLQTAKALEAEFDKLLKAHFNPELKF